MKRIRRSFLLYLLAAAVLFGSCHLEQGKLHFDELKLDPITVYKMAPLERTVFCLAEAEIPEEGSFRQMHARALIEVEDNPEMADWSKLVCLSLNEQASSDQIKETLHALQLVLSVQPHKTNPVRGFKKILEQEIVLYNRLEESAENLNKEKKQGVQQAATYEAEIQKMKNRVKQQRGKIETLTKQVRELKEVELLLQPQ